jgi:hypothetical protein
MSVDHELITAARLFMNGANVHFVNTCILCYEAVRTGQPPTCQLRDDPPRFRFLPMPIRTLEQSAAAQKETCVPFEAVGLLDQPEALLTVSMERNVA